MIPSSLAILTPSAMLARTCAQNSGRNSWSDCVLLTAVEPAIGCGGGFIGGNFIGLPVLRPLTASVSLTLGTVFVRPSRLFKKLLIRFSILDHDFRPAVQGEQQRAACGFQMLEKLS